MRKKSWIFAYVAICAVGAHSVQAEVLFEQPVDPALKTLFSNVGGQIVADQFKLKPSDSVTSVTWYGIAEDNFADSTGIESFVVEFYRNDGDTPALLPAYRFTVLAQLRDADLRVPAGFFAGHTIFEFNAALAFPVDVNSGRRAWLSIARDGGFQFLWSGSPATKSETSAHRGPGSEWTVARKHGNQPSSPVTNFAFTLHGDD